MGEGMALGCFMKAAIAWTKAVEGGGGRGTSLWCLSMMHFVLGELQAIPHPQHS